MPTATTILTVLACFVIFADAWTTYIGVKSGMQERNPIRAFLIRKLGLTGGTFGVAAAAAAGFALVLMNSVASPVAVLADVLVISVFGYVAFNNYQKLRARR